MEEDSEYDFATKEMEIWDDIIGLNTIVWFPMLVMGCLSLSGHAESQSAWWIENIISNLYWPVLINETYSLLEYAMFEGKWSNWAKLAVWSVPTFAVFATEMGAGSSAVSFLRGID